MSKISRRQFFKRSSTVLAGIAAATVMPKNIYAKVITKTNIKAGSGFTMWQLNTQCNQIGNTYVFLTDKGRVVVMDGGCDQDEYYLRGFLAMLGNNVDTWFVSHPHRDHIMSLNKILKEPRGIKIRRLIHSRFTEDLINGESKETMDLTNDFYATLDKSFDMEVVNLTKPGLTENIDGFNFKILGVSNPEFLKNPYNNSSVIIRVWDKKKSLVFLGDAGIECGNKVLASKYRKDLDCDYLQIAHHGQRGCDKHFYQTIYFKVCLWSTPKWVWENSNGNLDTLKTRAWMDEIGIKEHHVSWMGLWQLD